MTGLDWDWNLAYGALPKLWDGLKITLMATIFGMAVALILGMLLAVLRRSESKLVSRPAALAIEFVRSTPILIQLFFVFFLLPDMGWNTPLVTGILVLGVHYATYTSEAYRSGINSVSRGQWDVSVALNLTRFQTWTRIILPQAIPPIVPALGNYLVAMLKDTPLLFAISVRELLAQANNFNARVGSYVETTTMVGAIFLVMSLLAAFVIRWSEAHLVLHKA
jgi:polar amino acid transport system permease protein